jgi:hypothetical protein
LTVPIIFITGPVAVGKTTVSSEVSWIAAEAGIAHGGLDVDAVTWLHPSGPDALAYTNTAAVWDSYRQGGATHLVLAGVIYDRSDLDGFQAAVPGAEITVFRLRASLKTILSRVHQRERGGLGEEIHTQQAKELHRQMEAACVEDHLIETDGRSPHEIAAEIFDLSGWGPARIRFLPVVG